MNIENCFSYNCWFQFLPCISESTQKQNDDLNARNKCLNEKNLALRDEVNVFRAREEEMRTLVQIQQNILSPEKCKSDLGVGWKKDMTRHDVALTFDY